MGFCLDQWIRNLPLQHGDDEPESYEVTAQSGNLGNLVHEWTHVAVNEAHKHDFVNYPNATAVNVPARTYDALGRCTNEFDRQTRCMNDTSNSKISGTLQLLTQWANASELSQDKKTAVVSKFSYGLQWPHKEYDTVINQVLVWLYEWGYPIAGRHTKKPVVNALFEEVKKAVDRANQLRGAPRRKAVRVLRALIVDFRPHAHEQGGSC